MYSTKRFLSNNGLQVLTSKIIVGGAHGVSAQLLF